MNISKVVVDEKTLVDMDLEDTTYDETTFVDEENDVIFNPNTHNENGTKVNIGSDEDLQVGEDGASSYNRISTIPILHSDVGCSLPSVDDLRLSSGNVKKHVSIGNLLTNDHSNDTTQQQKQQQPIFRTIINNIKKMSSSRSRSSTGSSRRDTSDDPWAIGDATEDTITDKNDTEHENENRMGTNELMENSNMKKPWYGRSNCFITFGIVLVLFIITIIFVGLLRNKEIKTDPELQFNQLSSYLETNYGIKNLDVETTPQYFATRWMLDGLDQYPLPIGENSILYTVEYRYRFLCRFVLAILYYSIDGTMMYQTVGSTSTEKSLGWNFTTKFLDHEKDICDWNYLVLGINEIHGVGCYQQSLFPVYLQFRRNALAGTFPTEIGLLTSLLVFDFAGNHLRGTIPTEICQLSSLFILDVSSNKLKGMIPSCFGEQVDTLLLNSNLLEGPIPESLGTLTKLATLALNDNLLTGNPMNILKHLSKLTEVYMNQNQFTGNIGHVFSPTNHTFLVDIDLSHNNFSVTTAFPAHLLALPSLQVLDLSSTSLSVKFPESIQSNNHVRYISLHDNQIHGTLDAVTNLTGLEVLDVSMNKFSGNIIEDIKALTNLKILFLSHNNFTAGNVSESYFRSLKLEELSLRDTNRFGPLPKKSHNATEGKNLILLDFSSNKLNGTVPVSWTNFTNIEYLILNDNTGINGNISNILSKYTKLRVAFLDGTRIVDNFSTICTTLNKTKILGDELIYADCDDETSTVVECFCCECCPSGSDGCSKPFLGALESVWEYDFRRVYFNFTNKTQLLSSDILEAYGL